MTTKFLMLAALPALAVATAPASMVYYFGSE